MVQSELNIRPQKSYGHLRGTGVRNDAGFSRPVFYFLSYFSYKKKNGGNKMRVTKYDMLLNEEQHPYLVKEESKNCPDVDKMTSPEKIKKVMDDVFNASYLAEEHVWVIAMNVRCRPLGIFEISHGNVSTSLVGTREIFMRLMLCGASQFVMVHNHPTGDVSPSKYDINTTKEVVEAGKLMKIELCDHIIVGTDGYYSFRAGNLI